MKKTSDIQQELNELEVNLTAGFKPMGDVPEGFFQTFSNELMDRIKEEEIENSLPKELPYQIPSDYFNQFASQLNQEIHQEQFLSSLSRSMPYEVPASYFTELPSEINRKLPQPTSSLSPLILTRKWAIKLSMAASILLFLGIAFKTMIAPSHTNQVAANLESQLSAVSDAEIQQYLIEHQNEVESNLAIESVDENTIDLNTLESDVIDHTFNSISDEELLKYAL